MNNKAWHNVVQPTPRQVAQTQKAEEAFRNEIGMLAREGIPAACVLTALGMAVAEFITSQAEADAVAPWFEKQAAMLREINYNQKPN